MKTTDTFAGPLAKRLEALDVEDVIEDAYDIAVDEGREILRRELEAEGAPRAVIDAVQLIPEERYLHATVGVPGDHPAADAAEDFEYGDVDQQMSPAFVFRDTSQEMAAIATEEIVGTFKAALSG